MEQIQGINNIINSNDNQLHENTGQVLSTPQRNWSTHTVPSVHSTPMISCPRQGNVSGTSAQSSAWATNQSNQGSGVKNGSNSTEAWRHTTDRIEKSGQYWSTVNSTSTITCPRQREVSETSVSSSMRATNSTTQGFWVKNGSHSTKAGTHNNNGRVDSSEQNWSTPTLSTRTISCPKQGNASGTSVPSSAKPTNSIAQAKGFGEKNGSNGTEAHNYTITHSNKVKFAEFPSKPKKNIQLSVSGALQPTQKNPRKKFRKLIVHGVPEEEAIKLCLMPWPDIVKKYPSMIELAPEKRKNLLTLHIPPKEIPNLTSESDNRQDSLSKKDSRGSAEKYLVPVTAISEQPSLGSQNTAPLRVGIQNKEPMNPDQMKMVHHHLLRAITKQFTSGGGPEFLSFTHKKGWIQVTCVDQRSKDWLTEETQYLEPWPGVQLSVVPEEQLPNPPKVITKIPESEAASVQEALDLLKSQNKGLNTGYWQVLHERVEKNKDRIVTFIIDEKSLETLNAQNLQAALGFKIVTFRVKAGGSQLIRQPASPEHNPVTSDGSTIPENSGDLGLTYAKNRMGTNQDKHCSIEAKGNRRSGIVDLTVPDQDGFAALAAAERVTSQAKNGFGAKITQRKGGVIDLTENDQDEISGKNRSSAKALTSQPRFGARPTIQNSLGSDVRLGQGRSKEVNQTPVRGSQFSQAKNGAHLNENRDRTPSSEDNEEGGYSSWIIQEPESFAAGIVPGLSFLNSGGPPQFIGYRDQLIQDSSSHEKSLYTEGRLRIGTDRDSPRGSDSRLSPSKDLKECYNQLPKSNRLPVKSRRKDRGTDRDRPPRLNRPSPQRRNSQDLQRYDRPAYSQDNGRRDTVKSWDNTTRGHSRWRDEY